MAKYIVEERKTSKYEKNYKFPLVNIIPAIVWSIPVHQKLFPNANFWVTLGLCGSFVVFYVMLSYLPIIAVIPAVAGAIIFSGLFWVFADYIENQIMRIALKVLLEPGGIDHLESDRNSQFELNRNSQCTLAN